MQFSPESNRPRYRKTRRRDECLEAVRMEQVERVPRAGPRQAAGADGEQHQLRLRSRGNAFGRLRAFGRTMKRAVGDEPLGNAHDFTAECLQL